MAHWRNALRAAFLTTLVAVTSVMPEAVAADASALVAKVEAKYKDVTSIKAAFTQVSKSELFGDEKVEGDLTVKRPDKMRWAFGAEKLFVTDGKRMWIYTAEDRQVIEYDDISGARSNADALLTSLDKLDEQFKIDLLESSDTEHKLALAPREDGQFKKVMLTLDGALMVKAVVITDTFDNITELSFRDVKLNVAVDDSAFTFTVPDGVDVIKAAAN